MNEQKISSGIGFILVGVIILLLNFRIIDWSILSVLMVLWPLFFVVIGLNIILSRIPYARIGIWVAFVAVILFFTINIDSYPFIKKSQFNYYVPITYTAVAQKTESIPYSGEKMADLTLEAGIAGDIVVSKGNRADLAALTIPQDYAQVAHTVQGNRSTIALKDQMQPTPINSDGFSYAFLLNPDVAWDLTFKTGVISGQLNLEDVLVQSLDIQTGAGDLSITIDRVADEARMKIASGVASVELNIDPAIGLSVNQRVFISDNPMKEGWYKRGETYYSSNYDTAQSHLAIVIESAVSDVDINH